MMEIVCGSYGDGWKPLIIIIQWMFQTAHWNRIQLDPIRISLGLQVYCSGLSRLPVLGALAINKECRPPTVRTTPMLAERSCGIV